MALNFPDSPTLNQVYTDTTSGFSYQWDGVVWQSYAPASSSQIKIIDDISGSFNGSTQTFALAVSGVPIFPANSQQLRVVLGGIVQEPLVDYVVVSSSIAFTTPPSALLDCSIISLGPALPAVGIGSTATFYTRQSYNVLGTQSSFTVTGGYDIGFLDVYHNGVRLVVGIDYTANDGSGFTLTTAAQNGDVVEAISFVTSEYYTLNGIVNDLVVSGNASIGGNTYITGITTVLGSLNVIGGGNFSTSGIGTFGSLNVSNSTTSGNLSVTGITTLGNNVKVGVGSTALIVEGDARITGILTIGTSSITLDGFNNEIKIGTAITISSAGITGSASTATSSSTSYGLSGTPNIDVGIITATRASIGGSITELSQGQYWNVVTQADVGIGASQVPLNQYLGQLAFLDEYAPPTLTGTIQSFNCERTTAGVGGSTMSFGNGATNIKGLRMPFAGQLIAATLHGTLVTGTITVSAYVNGVENTSYQLTGTGSASDVNDTEVFDSPLNFSAGDTLGWYQNTVPASANGYVVSFYVKFVA
jgi:hypothetical protein